MATTLSGQQDSGLHYFSQSRIHPLCMQPISHYLSFDPITFTFLRPTQPLTYSQGFQSCIISQDWGRCERPDLANLNINHPDQATIIKALPAKLADGSLCRNLSQSSKTFKEVPQFGHSLILLNKSVLNPFFGLWTHFDFSFTEMDLNQLMFKCLKENPVISII